MRILLGFIGVAAALLLVHCLLIFQGGLVPRELVFTGVVISAWSAGLVGFCAALLLFRE